MGQPKTISTVDPVSLGDAAVDGLLAGLAGGLVMVVFLILAGPVMGNSPAMTLALFSESRDPVTGALAHLAVSSIYGMILALALRLLMPRARQRPWVILGAGVAYGLLLWLAAETLVFPGTRLPLAEIPWLVFLLAHLLYGAAAGWRLGK